jgi:hypothetical protein
VASALGGRCTFVPIRTDCPSRDYRAIEDLIVCRQADPGALEPPRAAEM